MRAFLLPARVLLVCFMFIFVPRLVARFLVILPGACLLKSMPYVVNILFV